MFDIKLNAKIFQYLKESNQIEQKELDLYTKTNSIPISSLVNILENDDRIFNQINNGSETIDQDDVKNRTKNCANDKIISTDHKNSKISIKQLLQNVDFKYKDKYIPKSNYSSEFKEQLEQLNLKLQEREYQEMVKRKDDISSKTKITMGISNDNDNTDWITPAQINKQIKEQITTIFNILVSVASVVYAIWYWTNSSGYFALEVRILLCLFFGLLILVAEIVVYNSYLNKIEVAKQNEKNKKVKKTIIKTFNINKANSITDDMKLKNE